MEEQLQETTDPGKYMLNVPSKRLNANQLLEKFMFKEKYGW